MPIVGGYYAYKSMPKDELLRLQLAWAAKKEAQKEQDEAEQAKIDTSTK